MADTFPPAGLLGRAGDVFTLAFKLGWALHEERESTGPGAMIDPASWKRHEPAFREFRDAVLALRGVIESPPQALAEVASELRRAAGVAREIEEAMRTPDGQTWARHVDFVPDLRSVAASGREAVEKARGRQRAPDPFAFLDRQAGDVKIDTTPTTPKPPPALIEAASLAIPNVLADVQPCHDGTVGLEASDLAKRLRDAGHTLASAQWAIHESILAGRLGTRLIIDEMPSYALPVGRRAMFRLPDTRGMEWRGGERLARAIPKDGPAPFDCFEVVATELLWDRWRSTDAAEPNGVVRPAEPEVPQTVAEVQGQASPARPAAKRGTERGEGERKLIAALTAHHGYADGGCLNPEPIGNNDLAEAAGVSPSTASEFFRKRFQGHAKYKAACRDVTRLADSLKLLNGEFSPHILYGRRPAGEDDRDGE